MSDATKTLRTYNKPVLVKAAKLVNVTAQVPPVPPVSGDPLPA
jgi:hypothetical protein